MSYQIRNKKTDKIIAISNKENKLKNNFKNTGLNKDHYYLCEAEVKNKKYQVLENSIKNL